MTTIKKNTIIEKNHVSNSSKITRNFNINVNKDEPELNDFLLSFSLFNRRPSKISLYSDFNPDAFWTILTEKYKINKKSIYSNTEVYPIGEGNFLANNRYTIELNTNTVITFLELDKMPDEETGYITNVVVYYDNSKVDMNQIFDNIMPSVLVINQKDDTPNISLIKYGFNQTLDLEPLMTSQDKIIKSDNKNFKYYYSESVTKNISDIIESFNASDSGLNIFHGEKGTGKTSLLLSIMDKIARKIIYVPNNLVDSILNNPDFFSLLKRVHNALIVIDDCEIINSNPMRYDNFNMCISQLVDGLQSNAINTQILLIYNTMDEQNINRNINNKLLDIKFDRLNSKNANKLAALKNNDNTYSTDVRLIDVLNDRQIISKNKLAYE